MTATTTEKRHICQPEFLGVGDMRGAYSRAGLLPTSTNADIFLIRSHIAYWTGSQAAERVTIRPSRGHTYRVTGPYIGNALVIRITDHYDHRNGVDGWN
jgi:hypothetical protein